MESHPNTDQLISSTGEVMGDMRWEYFLHISDWTPLSADLLIAEHARAEAKACAAQARMEDMQTDMERIQQAYMEQATRNEKLATALRSGRLRCCVSRAMFT